MNTPVPPQQQEPGRPWHRRAWIRRGVIGLVMVVVLATVGISTLFSSSHRATASASTLDLSQIEDMNYMPINASWDNMWNYWNPTQIATDYASIAAMGANTVRVIIPAPAFNFPNPSATMTGRLASIVSMATSAGLHVQLTLFDEWGLYSQIANSKTWINSLILPYKNNPEIAFIELQNELDPTNLAAVAWAQAMIPALQTDAGTIPVTLSAPGSQNLTGLEMLRQALASTPPNFYDYHYYGTPGQAYSQLAGAEAIAAPLSLFVGEAGLSTGGGNEAVLASQQAAFFTAVDTATSDLKMPPAAPWMMYDLNPAGAPAGYSASTLSYGLYTVAGVAKPAAAIERSFLTTGTVPGTVLNPGFEEVSGGVPTGWTASQTTAATLGVSSTVSHSGTYSATITDAAGTSANQPRWEQNANLGPVTDGQHIQTTAWVQGLNTTGSSALSVSWYNGSNTYLSTSSSSALPTGTTDWLQLGVNATAPAGAAYAVVNLESYANTGTTYFDDVNVDNLGSAAFPALPAVPATSGVGPVLTNPGFETATGNVPAGWAASGSTAATMGVSSTVSHTGTNSAYISASVGSVGAQPRWEQTANLGGITTGEHVQTLAWIKGTAATGYTSVAFAWFGATRNYLSGSTSAFLAKGTTDWTQIGANATAPAGAAYAIVNLESYANTGTVYFDDVTVDNLGTAAFPPLPAVAATSGVGNAVANPGFETVSQNVPTGWAASQSTAATMGVSSTVSHTGTNSAYISASVGSVGAQPRWEQTANLGGITTGEHIQTLAWMKGAAATGYTSLSMAWFGTTHNYLSGTTSAFLPTGTTNWTQIGVDATAPAGATYATVNLESYANTGTAYFDDVTVDNLGTAAFPDLAAVPATSGSGAVLANPGFETATGTVPAGWSASQSTAAKMGVSTVVSHSGVNSAYISAAAGTVGAEPRWEQTANLGAITTGEHIQLLAWAVGSGTSGYTSVSVAWFRSSHTYMSGSTSAFLPTGTTNWNHIGVDATAPAGAAYAIVNLSSYDNIGTVYFDDVTVDNLGTAAFPALPTLSKVQRGSAKLA